MSAPRPGTPVRGSATGRPVMALLDLLGRRWALRVLWELRGGALTFRTLQERCDGMSSSVLSRRLAELGEGGILTGSQEGYALTTHGRELLEALAPVQAWARRWARRSS